MLISLLAPVSSELTFNSRAVSVLGPMKVAVFAIGEAIGVPEIGDGSR